MILQIEKTGLQENKRRDQEKPKSRFRQNLGGTKRRNNNWVDKTEGMAKEVASYNQIHYNQAEDVPLAIYPKKIKKKRNNKTNMIWK
jgi:hypothetical protein